MKKYLMIFTSLLLFACESNQETADAYGHFEADDVIVSSEANGRVLAMFVEEGDIVNQGDTIAVVDTVNLVLQRKQLEAMIDAVYAKTQDVGSEIAVLQERLVHLTKERERVVSLLADSAATPKQLDDITAEINVVRKQVTAVRTRISTMNRGVRSEILPLEVKIEQINEQLSRCYLVARQTGSIQNLYVRSNEVVMMGKPVCKIADVSTFYLRAYLSGTQLGGVKTGQQVAVMSDGPEGLKDHAGTISWVSAEAEFTPKTIQTRDERVNLVYAVKIRVKNDGSLKTGMPGELVINKNNPEK